MAWYSFFTSAPKAADNILDKDKGLLTQVGNWVGGLNLTDEEVMEQNAKTVTSVQAFVKATLGESTERSKSRRDIAKLWIKTQLGIILMTCVSAPWNMELAEFYFKLATSTLMIMGTTAIIIFHFGSHGLARHNESKK
ncbi:MAG: hypothetical protein Unbinned1520contig1002_19 [Prokaryotic dsDNA virus sp.]|nr:MAG: hypothetical protein Unbinned1520contig1002_19 [Prokaryotic dsDNA virus sp.]|tara:strand:+ start:278 stop:691 length:414 start_codon:yes stop_codon:yes gene_type:complete